MGASQTWQSCQALGWSTMVLVTLAVLTMALGVGLLRARESLARSL